MLSYCFLYNSYNSALGKFLGALASTLIFLSLGLYQSLQDAENNNLTTALGADSASEKKRINSEYKVYKKYLSQNKQEIIKKTNEELKEFKKQNNI
jgi:hypothetical protein